MKKVKIMLMAIALVAGVGGFLAFKAKKEIKKYCTAPTTTVNGVKTCVTSLCTTAVTATTVGSNVCYTTTLAAATDCIPVKPFCTIFVNLTAQD